MSYPGSGGCFQASGLYLRRAGALRVPCRPDRSPAHVVCREQPAIEINGSDMPTALAFIEKIRDGGLDELEEFWRRFPIE